MGAAKKVRRIIFMTYLVIRIVVPASAEDTILLAYNGDPEKLAAWKFVHLVTDEIFRHLNIRLKYEVMPAKRAGFQANNGRADGDNARVYEYNKRYPNLLRVGEAIYTQVLMAYSADPTVRLAGWDSLRGKGYKVEYVRGVIFVGKKLSGVVSPENLSDITTRWQGLKKLAARRTDVFVDVGGLITSLLNGDEFEDAGIRQAGVMETTPLYLYLHKKHAALIPKLEKALIRTKADGLYDQYRQQVFGKAD